MNPLAALDGRYDAVVVGARCAGASTAMLLARGGMRVLALDRSAAGSDTISTHALMRGGVLQLRRWGLLERVIATGAPAVRTSTFHYGGEPLAIPIKPADGVEALYAPRRTVLDALLAGAAREAGAEVAHGVRAVDLRRDGSGRVRGLTLATAAGSTREIEAGLVIGADGIRSAVARWTGAPVIRRGRHATGVMYRYWAIGSGDGYQWHYRPGSGAGSIPTHDGLACVFVAVPQSRLRDELPGGPEAVYLRLLAEAAPGLAERLAGAVPGGPLRAFAGLPGFLRQAHGPGWALVGDAGFFRDPLTAHGITDALRDAELLARAALSGVDGALAGYEAARDALAREMLEISDEVASLTWDLARVQQLHVSLSRNMAREVDALRALDATPTSAAAVG